MSQLLSVKYDVIWNGNPAKWEQANTILWERLASANATRVILEEPKSYMKETINLTKPVVAQPEKRK